MVSIGDLIGGGGGGGGSGVATLMVAERGCYWNVGVLFCSASKTSRPYVNVKSRYANEIPSVIIAFVHAHTRSGCQAMPFVQLCARARVCD